MKQECGIVGDLLPLYLEDMVCQSTKEYVETHLMKCEFCREKQDSLRAAEVPAPEAEAGPLKKLKRALYRKRLCTIVLTALVVLIFSVSVFSYLTAPIYFPYAEGLVEVIEDPRGGVLVLFDEQVTDYNLWGVCPPEGTEWEYTAEAWTTLWDKIQGRKGNASVRIGEGEKFALYYSQNQRNDGQCTEDVLLYQTGGMQPADKITLPRLVLTYYLLLAVGSFLILGLLWLLLRKRPSARRKVEALLSLPVCYVAGYFCVMGSNGSSWAPQRDFALIMILAVLFECAFLLAKEILRCLRLRKKIS